MRDVCREQCYGCALQGGQEDRRTVCGFACHACLVSGVGVIGLI
jgi:hypothetical protein